nr:MAG TPA: hypothetical protein [Bacteriophage sp.]
MVSNSLAIENESNSTVMLVIMVHQNNCSTVRLDVLTMFVSLLQL